MNSHSPSALLSYDPPATGMSVSNPDSADPRAVSFNRYRFFSNLCGCVTGINNRHFIRITAIIRRFEVILFSCKEVSGPFMDNQKEQSVILKYPGICPECKATTKSGSHEPEAVLSEQTCSDANKVLQVIY